MGANIYEHANYWQIVAGKLWTKLDKNDKRAVQRDFTDKAGKTHTMFGMWANSWTGLITRVVRKELQYGIFMNIHMLDEKTKETAIITIPFDSKYAVDFMRRICSPKFNNLDATEVMPFSMEDPEDGKVKSFLILKQNGEKITSPYNKENPLPDWKKIIVRGKETWDNTDQLNFLWEQTCKIFGGDFIAESTKVVEENPNNEAPDLDDLPF